VVAYIGSKMGLERISGGMEIVAFVIGVVCALGIICFCGGV
jgi:hypothetical protein